MNKDIAKWFSTKRIRPSAIKGRSFLKEYFSDKSRIVYQSSFRRLQQKTQVFPLEKDLNISTRMSHTLEVGDVGNHLGLEIGTKLKENGIFKSDEDIYRFITIIENGCLLHDIGNPPFGHFGEEAIKKWFREYLSKNLKCNKKDKESITKEFCNYNGNAQGMRTVLKLHNEHGDFFGLNLTYSTLMASLKYNISTQDVCKPKFKDIKKAGYFLTEEGIFDGINKNLDSAKGKRSPFVYIVEAADDISYCMSDIHDGIRKRILTSEEFFKAIKEEWKLIGNSPIYPMSLPIDSNKDFRSTFSVPWAQYLIRHCTSIFERHYKEILQGKHFELVKKDKSVALALETLKNVARKKLYRSQQAENIELAGYKIITKLLDAFKPLMELDKKSFELLIRSIDNPKVLYNKEKDYEWRLFQKLKGRHLDNYIMEKENKYFADYELNDKFLRLHLIVDYISGMTDGYAKSLYQLLHGITLEI